MMITIADVTAEIRAILVAFFKLVESSLPDFFVIPTVTALTKRHF